MPTQMGSDRWWVFGDSRVHGPFTKVQMIQFTREYRVVGQTQVRAHTDTEWRAARDVAWLAAALMNVTPLNANDAPQQVDEQAANSHLLIWAEIRSDASGAFAAIVAALGAHTSVAPGLYAVRTIYTAEEARQRLMTRLGNGDRVLIVDATRDQIGWVNLGPETEAKLKLLWRAPPPPNPANDSGPGRRL
jgi:hypothetical protein